MVTDLKKGPRRETLSDAAVNKVESLVGRVRSERRRRPLYFDGRFLAARDLTREQDYVLARQADLGRAGGFGIVEGLLVERSGASIRIAPGHGVTPSGEMVALTEAMTIDVGMLEPSATVRARVGILSRVRERPATRTGLYIVALRPIEYEANPIAKYPTTLDGERGVHNGDIIEATAVTLIPYPDVGEPTALEQRRMYAAKEIFVDQVRDAFVADALPLAMVAIRRGELLWIDSHLVRRELGAEAGDILGVSGAPLALREAHMLQYADHLRDTLEAVHGGIVASQHFLVLPPAGPMPKSAIDRQSFTQRFFPAEVDVDLSVIPEDELGAVLEEARLLAPIDLTDADALRSTSVVVLVPVPREDLDASLAGLVSTPRKLPASAPNLFARLRPIDRLARLPLLRQEIFAPVPAASPEDIAWRKLLDLDHANDVVWFVRRKCLSTKPSIVAEVVPVPPVTEGQVAKDLLDLASSLKEYGVKTLDARRVDPPLWEAARDLVKKLSNRPPLIRATAVLELSQAAPLESTSDVKAWLEAFEERLARSSEETEKLLVETFKPGRQATAVLVRTGILHEFAVPFSKLAEQPDRMEAWQKELRSREQAKQPEPTRAASLRALLFVVLDVDESIKRPQ